jgi:hypothetical protein
VIKWEPVVEWISNVLASPRLDDVRSKLARTGADERHAFLGVTFTSPGKVFFALDLKKQTLPPDPPRLPDPNNLRLVRTRSGFCEPLEDYVRDALGHLVGKKEDLSRDGHDTNMRARLEHRPLVLGQRAIALLGMHDPRGHVRLAQPARGVVVAM